MFVLCVTSTTTQSLSMLLPLGIEPQTSRLISYTAGLNQPCCISLRAIIGWVMYGCDWWDKVRL